MSLDPSIDQASFEQEAPASDSAPSELGQKDWAPRASIEAIRARAAILTRIREFFANAGVMEVETPILSRAGNTDPALASLVTQASFSGLGQAQTYYLQTSPELPMKRLLAAGAGPIYQICKVFRDEERGRLHHPEFTLLEWYRPGWNQDQLMDEVADLVRTALRRPRMRIEKIRYRELFLERLDLDPWTATQENLRATAESVGIGDARRLDIDRDGWLDLLMTHCLESRLGRGCIAFLCDYPPSQAALARIRNDEVAVAERFELYIEGVELGNGFHELTDAAEQRRRFAADLAVRRGRHQSVPPVDERFLSALEAGMPDCAGVAIGVDRLLMLDTGAAAIDAVLGFPIERA